MEPVYRHHLIRLATVLMAVCITIAGIPSALLSANEILAPGAPVTKQAQVDPGLWRLFESTLRHESTPANPRWPATELPTRLVSARPLSVPVNFTPASSTQALLVQLNALGLQDGIASRFSVSGLLPIESIPALSTLSELRTAQMAHPFLNAGSVDSQGDVAQNSADARTTYNIDGSGITVGVLSDSYDCLNGASTDIASGDLPADTTLLHELNDCNGGTDEGRAMMQIVHDVAPGASLIFHTGFEGRASFAQGIRDLAAAGADVIVDDIGYLGAPMFQDGVVAQAVDEVVAGGVAYFSSAGNSARDAFEGAFRSGTVYAFGDFSGSGENFFLGGTAHDFDLGAGVDVDQTLTVSQGSTLLLTFQWDEPYASVSGTGASNDIDIYLLNNDRSEIVASSANDNLNDDPFEIISYENTTNSSTFHLMVMLSGGAPPSFMKYMVVRGGSISEWDTASGTVFGHPNAGGAEAVGAANYQKTPVFGTSPPVLESFSSAGNTPILFDTSGNRVSITRQKPEIVAPDGASNTFFPSPGSPNFFGTSAAAPHAAGAAALMLEFRANLTPAMIYSALESTAIDMESAGFDNDSGYGLIDVEAAISSLVVPPDAPTNVVAIAGNQQAAVSWSAPAANGGDSVTGYVVMSIPGGITATSTAASTVVNGLTNGTSYSFTVAAENSAGVGASSTASAAVTPATVPGTPTNVVAEAGIAAAVVTWDAPASDGGLPINSYTIISSQGDLTASTTGTTGTTMTGLTTGVSYTFTVVAANSIGASASSTASGAIIPLPGIGLTPATVIAVNNGDRAQFAVTVESVASSTTRAMVNLQHGQGLALGGLVCLGPFATAASSTATTTGGTLFECNLGGGTVSSISGSAMSVIATRLVSGSLPIAISVGGVTSTTLFAGAATTTPIVQNNLTVIEGATIAGSISLQGISSTSLFATTTPTIILTNQSSGTTTEIAVGDDGSFILSLVAPGTYTVVAEATGYVVMRLTDLVVSTEDILLSSPTLRAGLVNDDSVVDLTDVLLVAAQFGTITDRPNTNGHYTDANADGLVDLTDVLLAANSFGLASPQSWP